MHSMDLPRGRLDRSFGQPSEREAETDSRARAWVPDGSARSPAELLDNLRLSLSQLADNHPSSPRNRHAPGDRGAPADRRGPRDRPAMGEARAPGYWNAPRDWGAPSDWDVPRDRGMPRDRGTPRHRGTPRDRDAPEETGPADDWDALVEMGPPDDWDALEEMGPPGDWDAPEDPRWRPEQDAWRGESEAAGQDIGSLADQPAASDGEAGPFGGLADAIRAASRLSDAFPASVDGGGLGEMSLFAHGGPAEPYRPWFMSGEPSTPWWAADEGQ